MTRHFENAPMASFIDQTLLGPSVTRQQAREWAERSILHPFASLCLSPWLVPQTVRIASETGVPVCTVVGFPHGIPLGSVKAYEAARALEDGAVEIDMVMNVGAFLSGDVGIVADEIAAVASEIGRAAVPGSLLKVILCSAFLSDEKLTAACRLVVDAGADFVKTSTGYEHQGATEAHIRLMREAVGPDVGVKASGGIRDLKTARSLLAAGADRIGTSRGLEILAAEDR